MKEIFSNLEKTIPVIKNLIYLSEPELIGLPEIRIEDYDGYSYSDSHELTSVMLNIVIKLDSEDEFSELIKHIEKIHISLLNILSKISFDSSGELFKAKVGRGLRINNIMMVHNLKFSMEKLEIDLDVMFSD
jgi:hypothetical protein